MPLKLFNKPDPGLLSFLITLINLPVLSTLILKFSTFSDNVFTLAPPYTSNACAIFFQVEKRLGEKSVEAMNTAEVWAGSLLRSWMRLRQSRESVEVTNEDEGGREIC